MAHLTTREEHPLPAVLMHWTHLLSMLVLIISGFYIHSPFGRGMQTMRSWHFVAMFVLIYVAIIRIYWAFFGAGTAAPGSRRKKRDILYFLPERENRGQFGEIIKYYLFLRRTHPRTSKYNTLQKGTYIFWLILIVLQAITGFELWTPTAPALQPLTYALGGTAFVRQLHYIFMWVFIITIAVHIYLVLVEAIQELPLMFLWRESATSRSRAENV